MVKKIEQEEKVFMKYHHHGADVSVREDLKGTNRDLCMCYDCSKFILDPITGKSMCPIAYLVFQMCERMHLVTPVLECPEFEQGERYQFTTEAGLP